MKTQPHRQETPRIVIPDAAIRILTLIGYAIAGAAAGQFSGC